MTFKTRLKLSVFEGEEMKNLLGLGLLVMSNFAMANGLVSVVQLEDGKNILTDAKSRTVYTFDVDSPNQSNCHDRCLNVWPPIIVPEETIVLKPFGVITTEEGIRQLTLNEKPLYHFISDQNPTDTLGDNVGNVWHIIEVNLMP